jgi:hypothetical protein
MAKPSSAAFAREKKAAQETPAEMTADHGFELHPGAAMDVSEIWEYIAKDDLLRLGASVKTALSASSSRFPTSGTVELTSLSGRCVFRRFAIT